MDRLRQHRPLSGVHRQGVLPLTVCMRDGMASVNGGGDTHEYAQQSEDHAWDRQQLVQADTARTDETRIRLGAIVEPFLVEQLNMILLPTDCGFDNLLPNDAKLVTLRGFAFHAVPNTPLYNSLLYSAGYNVSSPIYFDEEYDWSDVQVYDAQVVMAGLLVARRRCFNLSAVGTGKTIGTLAAVDWLIERGHINKVLIAAPLSILWTVWEKEIYDHFPRLRPIVLHGPRSKRLLLLGSKSWNVAIINHDGLKVIQQELLDQPFGMLVIDEAASFRYHTTNKWRVMNSFVEQTMFVAALTGSPTPNAPSDAYGLARLITPQRCGRSFMNFKMQVEKEINGRWIPRKNAPKVVAELLQPAVRFKRSDIIELKGHYFQRQKVDMSPEQIDAIKRLKKDALIKYPEGVVTAVNAAVLVNKLLQICCGAVYTTERDVIDLKPKQRIETVKTIIDSAEGKVIVLVPYIHATQLLYRELSRNYDTCFVTGAVSGKERTTIFARFQDRLNPLRVMVAHPKVLAHGVNLTAANVIVWFSPIYSREIYHQANGRITRLGQDREQFIIHLFAGKEEDVAYRVLDNKGKMEEMIFQMFELVMQS